MGELELIGRVRNVLAGEPVAEQRMFGGVAFMLNGNMLVAASARGLMVRVGKENEPAALALPHAATVAMGGRPKPGYIRVLDDGYRTDADLATWVERAFAHVRTLPPKQKAPKRTAKA